MPEPVLIERAAETAGWYGKLPALGDFVQRRLPPSFVDPWDAWLQRGLQGLKAAPRRDDQGDEREHSDAAFAPVRRFWLAPGVIDALGWGGLLMPSSDRAGRRFPLTVAQPMTTLAQALAARHWLASVVAAMRFTLDHAHTLDDFEECLQALPVPSASSLAASRADAALAAAVLPATGGDDARSAWWLHGAARADDFLVFHGLPPPPALATLIEAPPR
jgi:type VI secretion system protein ImpM